MAKKIKIFHKKIKNIGQKRQVIQNTKFKHKKLEEVIKLIRKTENSRLKKLNCIVTANKNAIKYWREKFRRQITHGDLHPGNVLFCKKTKRITIIDFEETCSSYYSVYFDVAFIIERFILQKKIVNSHKTQLIRAFLNEYAKNKKEIKWFKKHAIEILKSISIRSLLILAKKNIIGESTSSNEWHKFIRNYHNSINYLKIFKSI